MTTKEFIKMLKKADPKGTSHVRIDGTVPTHANLVEGYWDGPYTYINDKKQFVLSTRGNKVEIYTRDKESMVEDVMGRWDPWTGANVTKEELWEKIKQKYVFELDDVFSEERIESFLEPVREHFEWYYNHELTTWPEYLDKVIELYKKGCRFFRKKEVGKMVYYSGWEFINKENPKIIGYANLATTKPILKSGRFKAIETDMFPNNEYFEFILI